MTSGEPALCQLCELQGWRYKCPRCNVHYCSLACYKGDKHKSCSETFYQAEYASNLKGERASDDERRQTLEMLQRQRQLDIEYEADGFTGIDSGEQVEQGDDDFADRFGSLDLDKESAEGVWAKLSAAEQQKFLTIVQTGAIEQLLRAHEPWWIEHKAALVLEENEGGEGAKDGARKRPAIVDPLPKLRDLVKSDPSPQLPFNLIDVLFAYAVVVRRYSGDHTSEQTVRQAVSDVLQLSIVLQQKSAFVHESVPSAAAFCTIRAIDELKMRGHAAATALEDVAIILRGTLTSDVCAALSELHGMFRSCKDDRWRKVWFYIAWAHAQPPEMLKQLAAVLDAEASAKIERHKQHEAAKQAVEDLKEQQTQKQEQKRQQKPSSLIQEI